MVYLPKQLVFINIIFDFMCINFLLCGFNILAFFFLIASMWKFEIFTVNFIKRKRTDEVWKARITCGNHIFPVSYLNKNVLLTPRKLNASYNRHTWLSKRGIKFVQDGHRRLACHSTLLLPLRENDLFQFLKCKMYVEWTFKIMYVVQAFHSTN